MIRNINQLLQQYPTLQSLVYLLGLWALLSKSRHLILFLYRNLLRPSKNLSKKYGVGSWALITGASDGIGKQIAFELAKRSFNIILIARNIDKLKKVEQSIQMISSSQTKIIVADFQNSLSDENFFDKLSAEIQSLDISILVNNVGVDAFDKFHTLSEKQIKDLVTINCIPMTILTKRLIPKLQKRGYKRSAIVNTTSLAGQVPTSYFNVYSATKAYGEFLTNCLHYEYPDIDVISLSPSEVSTQMTYNRPPDLMTITAQDCARGLMSKIGYDHSTNGDWRHQLQGILYRNVPLWLYSKILINFIVPQWLKEREIGAKQKQS